MGKPIIASGLAACSSVKTQKLALLPSASTLAPADNLALSGMP